MSKTSTAKSIPGDAQERLFHVKDKVAPEKNIVPGQTNTMLNRYMRDISSISELRMEFIEILSQEFLTEKGYGVYAYLTPREVMHLFEHFLDKGEMNLKTFAKEYVRSF